MLRTQVIALIITLPFNFMGFDVANADLYIKSPEVEYRFGEFLRFYGDVGDPNSILESYIYLDIPGENAIFTSPIYIQPDHSFKYEYPIIKRPLKVFSTIEYWIEITSIDHTINTSQKQSFLYQDNRHEWMNRKDLPFQVFWYQGDITLGNRILNVSQSGLNHIQQLLPVPELTLVQIYAYSSAQELRDTLQATGQVWIGAHTDPDHGVILLSLPKGPSQYIEMERQIPHELMHILLYQIMNNSYAKLPTWLSEGLASNAELYPNPDYTLILKNASEKQLILSIESLCENFPKEASGALLAYAESSSFVNFLLTTYGSSKMMQLLDVYKDGLHCERGVEVVYQKNIIQLERNWREETLGETIWENIIYNVSPWLLLFILLIFTPIMLFGIYYKRYQTFSQ